MDEQIAVVDAENQFLRWAPRRVIHTQRLVHRSVYVLVFDGGDRLLIQRRHRNKQTYPGHWDISCAGHVGADDYHAGPDDGLDAVYRLAAERELAEELGVTAPIEEIAHFAPVDGVHYEQIRLYRARWDAEIRIQAAEVEATRWLTGEALAAMIGDGDAQLTMSLRWLADWLWKTGRWSR
jgi:isopentenyldiphosphate isomerase